MKNVLALATATLLVGCASQGVLMRGEAKTGCASLAGASIGAATVDSATLVEAAALSINERAPTPAGTINPATPEYCKVLGTIAPTDPKAPPIKFEVNLPTAWNGRSVQYGGGGFNGVLITGLGLVPAAPYDRPAPLGQGFVTVGTDSGHQHQPNQPPQAFSLNDEALVNFAHASYKKVRDVSVELMKRAYGKGPAKLYFVGSSEGGREGLTMAQRYPDAFDGIFSRVPVIHWTGLQHAGLRDGLALVGDGWISPAKVRLVHDAVLAACDAADGVADGIVSDPLGCRSRFDVTRLRCTAAVNDGCLSDAQVRAVQTLHADLPFPVELANGLRSYPGRGPSAEALPATGPTGGWMAWWTGASAPAFPPKPDNGIAWYYGAGAIQYFYAQDANADVRSYKPENHVARVQEISALMDSTNPDLSAFRARGGKLIVLENLGDYAQSPYAGIAYVESVKAKLGRDKAAEFLRLYTAPGVDHVGTGAPANADFLGALVGWVEQGSAPAGLTLLEQNAKPPFATLRSRPLCEWPALPRYRVGDANAAASFDCKLAIDHLLDRQPRQLSGGQLQRVAIGRAIVRNARLYLFDEPLSNLDAQLREEIRGEIKRLHQELGKTMIYVTHDQIEAMTMADRIVLMRDGCIEQQGAPLDLYERPATRYVAGFLGSPAMNFVNAVLVAHNGGIDVRLSDGTLLGLPATRTQRLAGRNDGPVVLGVRPEHISRAQANGRPGVVRHRARIDLVQPTGARTYATFPLGGTAVVAELQAHDVSQPGEHVELAIDMNRAVLIDPSSEHVIS